MLLRILRLATWTLVAGIVFVTLAPLQDRPRATQDPQVERFLAFFALGLLFAVSYPRRRAQICVALVVGAFGLEAAQHLTPDRHGALRDALAKSLGGVVGLLAAELLGSLWTRLRGGASRARKADGRRLFSP